MLSTSRARALRRRSTWAETVIWRWLRHRYLGGFKFRRQHAVGPYVLDFYCPALRLCIEVDGGIHDQAFKRSADSKRSCELSMRGIKILRLRNELIETQPDACWTVITDAIDRRRASFWLGVGEKGPSP